MWLRRSPLPLHAFLAALLALLAAAGCGGGDDGGSPTTPPPPPPTGDLSPVVGSWTADTILVNPKSNPAVSREIVSADGVSFAFTVQSSGSYQAELRAFGDQSQETGTVRVNGNVIFFSAKTPLPGNSQGTFSRSGPQLILLGDLRLDFNQDGIVDDLDTRFVLSPS